MQSIFRLPWCSEHQIKLSEKASLDRMRPMVQMPVLQELKRKRPCSENQDLMSAATMMPPFMKKQQMDYARHFSIPTNPPHAPTPHSAHASPRLVPTSNIPRPSAPPASMSPRLAPPASMSPRLAPPASAPPPSAPPDSTPPPSAQPASPPPPPSAQPASPPPPFAQPASPPPPSAQPASVPPQPATPTAEPAARDANPIIPETPQDEALRLPKLQQVIENEFNMQILIKHNEVRLIEQELAKCQIALEQLRRCELRPFPGTDAPSRAVSDGTGPAIAPPLGHSVPSHPAPFGVTDGPYSKHYAQWLLRDPQFDSVSPEALALAEARVQASGRPSRHACATLQQPRKSASKPLGTSTRSADLLHCIPHSPALPPKNRSQPLLLPRSSDGQLVKLICNNCERGNFSSIQGFLNHCRIAHKVDYKSHDAAALDCGRLLDAEERASMPPEAFKVLPPKPSARSAAAAAATTPAPAPPCTSVLVHPYITVPPPASRPIAPAHATAVPNLRTLAPAASRAAAPFQPSRQTPTLSALYRRHGLGGDLEHAVARATHTGDLDADLDPPSPDPVSAPPSPATPVGPGARLPAGTHAHFPPPQSRKGLDSSSHRARPAPIAPPAPAADVQPPRPLSSPRDRPGAALRPNTADGNPGMVSDHDDDDHSVSEGETPPGDGSGMQQPPHAPDGGRCSAPMEMDGEQERRAAMGARGVVIR